MDILGGHPTSLRIFYTTNALRETTERLFPASKNRSKRIHKKLVKRFGGEFKKVPCMWQTPQGIYAHPSFKVEIERAFAAQRKP